ncbi:hypothetical protein CRUP_014203, partial [Coryphaenoides rupestris]
RPPLIWDNLHANDYDSRRLFLGPFKGREPGLRDHLRGLLLNPNCEFEANYIPLHTLGRWHRTPPPREEEVGGEGEGGRQSTTPTARAKTPERAERSSALAKPLPMFPLSSGSPPPSPAPGGEGPRHKAQGRVPSGGKALLSEAQVRLL